jgi:hypothetical protein
MRRSGAAALLSALIGSLLHGDELGLDFGGATFCPVPARTAEVMFGRWPSLFPPLAIAAAY